MEEVVYSSKINKIRSFALALIFVGFAVMYGGLLARKIEWLMLTLFIFGMLFIAASTLVYIWIGMLSTRAIPIICPNCEQQTKMLGRVDGCMHCKKPLTMDKELEGKPFDEKYNSRKYKREMRAKKNEQKN